MQFRWEKLCRVAAAVCLLYGGSTATGAVLAPGGLLFPAPSEPSGGVIVDSLVTPFVADTFSGSLTTVVLSGDPLNPLGGLTFVYHLTNDAGSMHSIGRVTLNGFGGNGVDAVYSPAVNTVGPAYIDRPSSDLIGFSFLGLPIGQGLLAPGTDSAFLVVRTDSTTYVPSVAAVIDGSIASAAIYAPAPEPAAFMLLAGGGMWMLRRPRRVRG
jgi:hypothetical protein